MLSQVSENWVSIGVTAPGQLVNPGFPALRVWVVIMESATRERLVSLARTAAQGAYCKYSRYRVGAAVLAGGKFYSGCNIENASYGLTVCAERVAIFNAISDGQSKIDAMAVTCLDAPENASPGTKMPCGACRQVLAEFGTPDIVIIVDGVGDFVVADLLPEAFRL